MPVPVSGAVFRTVKRRKRNHNRFQLMDSDTRDTKGRASDDT